MNRFTCRLCVAVALCSAAWADSACVGQILHSPQPCVLTGNGGLTAGVGASGSVSYGRWPSPGHSNQVEKSGLVWGVEVDGRALWLDDAAWLVAAQRVGTTGILTESAVDSLPLVCTQEVVVHPTRDVLMQRLTIRGAAGKPSIFWSGAFTPHLRIIPGLPIDWTFYKSVAFDMDSAAYHVGLVDGGMAEWRQAETMAAVPETANWASVDEAVWVACTSETLEFINHPGPGETMLEMVAEPNPEGAYTATVAVVFGQTKAGADSLLEFVRQQTFESVAAAAATYWDDWLTDTAVDADLLTLAQCTDRDSGAIVRSPAEPWLALDWVRSGAWTTLALDLAGYRDMAEKHTLFYAGLVRTADKPGMPYGSMPAAVYADGTDGVPSIILEADAPAWMLASFWRHAQFLEGAAREMYLETVWESVLAAGGFLSTWVDGRTREPFFSFDPEACRDTQSIRLLLTQYMGVDAALRIATELGKAPPDQWKRRKTDLDILIRFHCVGADGQWKVPDILPFWAHEFAETNLPSWDAIVEQRLPTASAASNADIQTLCDATLVWQDQPAKLKTLRPLVDAVRAQDVARPDSYASALRVIATTLVSSSGQASR